jgi:hypothetical protein
VMSRTESPPAVLRRRSYWYTFTGADVSDARERVRRSAGSEEVAQDEAPLGFLTRR